MNADDARCGTVLRALRERALRLEFPLFALWELTQRCDLRCRHCYLRGKHEQDELSTAEARSLLAQMARLGVMFVMFTGGEPLLRRDFFELAGEARALGFAWKLLTSGTLVDEKTARRIAGLGPFGVSISLYGLEETHDRMTSVPGSFAGAVGAIERLSSLGVPVTAKTCLTPGGLGDLPALRELCSALGVTLSVGTVIHAAFDGTPPRDDLRLSEEDLARYHAAAGEDGQLASGSAPFRIAGGRLPTGRAPKGRGEHATGRPVCNAGRSLFAVSPRGDVRACLLLRRTCGNVREAPLRDIWTSQAMVEARELVGGMPAGCGGCEAADFCRFCPGLAEMETGSALSPPPSSCREARVRRRLWEAEACGEGAGRESTP